MATEPFNRQTPMDEHFDLKEVQRVDDTGARCCRRKQHHEQSIVDLSKQLVYQQFNNIAH